MADMITAVLYSVLILSSDDIAVSAFIAILKT